MKKFKALNQLIKERQLMLLALILSLTFLVVFMSILLLKHKQSKIQSSQQTSKTFDLTDPIGITDQKNVALRNIKKQLQEQLDQNDQLKGRLESLENNTQHFNQQIQSLEQESLQLHSSLNAQASLNDQPISQDKSELSSSITQITVQLSPQIISGDKTFSPQFGRYIPANSYVKGIILSGADTSTGVNSQSDPSPILVRLIDKVSLPNGKSMNLTDCRISLATFGKISSSRSMGKASRLSCVEPDNTILDIEVKAYLTGPDGKEGVRGKTVHHQMPVIRNAMLAGAISGLSDTAKASLTTTSVSPLGVNQTVQGTDALAYSAAGGVGKGSDKIAEYLMKLAEQYEPIVELHAGTQVEIVFIEGFYFNDRVKEQAPNHRQNNFESTSSIPKPSSYIQGNHIMDEMALASQNNTQDWLQTHTTS